MLITIKSIVDKYNLSLKGVIHLGAHLGEEAADYKNVGCNNVIWIEGNPFIFKDLLNSLTTYPGHLAFNFLISDIRQTVKFNITDFSQSSSILELGITKEMHNTKIRQTIELETKRIDEFLDENKIEVTNYDFVNLDLQGYELKALKSFGLYIKNIEWIYTEINKRKLYKGCPLLHEMDIFLCKNGFKRIETVMTEWYWGDALYTKHSFSLMEKIILYSKSYLGYGFRIIQYLIIDLINAFKKKFIVRAINFLKTILRPKE